MTQYNCLNVKLSNSQLNILKSVCLTNRKVANIRKAFANHSSTNIKLSKSQLLKMIQLGGFLSRLLGP